MKILFQYSNLARKIVAQRHQDVFKLQNVRSIYHITQSIFAFRVKMTESITLQNMVMLDWNSILERIELTALKLEAAESKMYHRLCCHREVAQITKSQMLKFFLHVLKRKQVSFSV